MYLLRTKENSDTLACLCVLVWCLYLYFVTIAQSKQLWCLLRISLFYMIKNTKHWSNNMVMIVWGRIDDKVMRILGGVSWTTMNSERVLAVDTIYAPNTVIVVATRYITRAYANIRSRTIKDIHVVCPSLIVWRLFLTHRCFQFHNIAHDLPTFTAAFGEAWYKLTSRDMGPVTRCVGSLTPQARPFQYPLPDASREVLSLTDQYGQ